MFFCLGLVSIKYKNPYRTYITVPWMIPQNILTFHSWENINLKFICLIEIWITWPQMTLAKSQSQIPNMYSTLEKEITNLNLLYYWNFIIPSGNMLFPMLQTSNWLHRRTTVAYSSREYHNSRQNITILFWNYLFWY